MKMGTGWFMTFLMLAGLLFLLTETASELLAAKSLETVINERVNLTDIELTQNSYILEQHSQIISEIYSDENRIYLPYEAIPQTFIDAFIATEDHRFFEHQGYDLPSIFRAVSVNFKNNDIEEGASTITQQLVRNLYLSHDVSYERKFTEVLYASKMEKKYTKEEIIELYLNTIFFHNRVYGIESASQFYFSKSSDQLSLAEVAFLTAVPNNPSYYNPLNHSDRTHLRKDWVLEKMAEYGAVDAKQLEKAKQEEIVLNVKERIDLFPDYVTFVLDEFTDLIATNEGYLTQMEKAETEEGRQEISAQLNERVNEVMNQGIQIKTALDSNIQHKAIQAFETHLGQTDIQGAATVIDHQNDTILAITGGRNYQKFDFHRGFQSFRQPGSALKPLLVFAPYLEESGASLATTVNANNVCYVQNGRDYCPKNYGGGEYGHVTLTQAFQHSYNTPVIRLMDQIGINTAFSYLEPFSFEKVVEQDYQLASAIGGLTYGFSPLEMTRAYSSFAKKGSYTPARAIEFVTDLEGNRLYEWEKRETNVWSEETNEKMRALLAAVITSGTGQRAAFSTSYIGGKTGTTNNYYDLWFVGLTEDYTAGVWIGKDIGASLLNVNSRQPQISIWKDIVQP
ncbi:penicillin-binding protein 4 [Alkalihalobacillus alcalophilus ATCC 27647 = CGMCC 1.3604]|uniref:Penicillin-binding protein n=1 Tax=Alkalihalobacillus alcalophilus ATCC 27647 = CGMCC 1.3604 TaxID=1218173 RepID=A0A094XBA3_ALKAL|nr:transglycosylase domain-containing protein [Alkalihalobacillus alcalophilus]KGA96085.1 penicillin-binding protein [Alkalihalobacillus alcalophilus ATCC 27647 = CGMCC 1.3604]MED1561084.1 transglycosylase domain-containing protein [Alkalihalobacillus alcalophilus]THG88788.1 penicillin-binding protein 4 [Alkalihalobacillus alcalophilus ATCC 27647 = CGMCC 1.3604]